MDDMNKFVNESGESNEFDNQNDLNDLTTTSGKQDKRGFAITSLILGIVSLVLFCIWYISLPCAILGIIFGALSTKSSGRGMAIAGIVTSIIAIAVDIVVVIFAAAMFSELMYTMTLL